MAQEKQYNRLDTALIIADVFNDAYAAGVTSITTQELLGILGIEKPDFEYENVEFDLASLNTRQNLDKLEEEIYTSDYFNGRLDSKAA